MAPRIKTRERIVQNSLELFNQQGERSVSTNHIAAYMEISPGNLYYHFPNKQAIIAVLFSQYEELVDSFLRPPQAAPRRLRTSASISRPCWPRCGIFAFCTVILSTCLKATWSWLRAIDVFPNAACSRAKRSTVVSSMPGFWPWSLRRLSR